MFVQEVYPEVQHEAAHQDPQDRAAGRAERRRRRHPQLRPVEDKESVSSFLISSLRLIFFVTQQIVNRHVGNL